MNNWPQPAWAVVLALQGTIIAIVVLIKPTPENIALAVLAVASNLVSGALGAFAGHSSAMTRETPTPQQPAGPAETSK